MIELVTSPLTFSRPLLRVCFLALVSLTLSACAKQVVEKPGTHDFQTPSTSTDTGISEHTPFGPTLSLEGLIRERKAAQLSLAGVYEPPPEGMADAFVTQLVRERPVIHLMGGVHSYAGNEDGIAMGLDDGQILVFSDWPCSRLALPESLPVTEIAWSPGSPVLAALANDRKRLRVFDLRLCGLVLDMALKGSVTHAAVSSDGRWVAVTDESLEMRIGPPQGPLAMAGRLRFAPLAVSFSPEGRLLLVVDGGGWVTIWDPSKGAQVSQFHVGNGPYAEARLSGRELALTSTDGRLTFVDLASRKQIPREDATSSTPSSSVDFGEGSFALRDGVLLYRLADPAIVRKLHLGQPRLRAYLSGGGAALLLEDLDGARRVYDTSTGALLRERAPESEWKEVPLAAGQVRTPAGELFLADCAAARDGLMLMSRVVPGAGRFLWWTAHDATAKCPDTPQGLPGREGIARDSAISWMETPEISTHKESQIQ